MLKTLRNAFQIPDLRKRLLITVALLAVIRAGIYIPVPGVRTEVVKEMVSGGTVFGFLDILSGGGYQDFSVFAMGIVPYINASIIMSLLTIAIPKLEQMQKEGEDGRRKIQEITRYAAMAFALLQAITISIMVKNKGALVTNVDQWVQIVIMVVTLTAGTVFVMWIAEKITELGIGNGSSMIIAAGILARIPAIGHQIYVLLTANTVNIIEVLLLLAGMLLAVAGVVVMDLAERRIPVQYAQRRVGMKSFGGQSTHIPINVNSSGVIAIIFAISVMQFPMVITQIALSPENKWRVLFESGYLSSKYWVYPVVYVILIIFFTWFYTSVTFKPEEVAQNLQKNGGFVPGFRPGKPTEEYMTRILNRMTLIGGVFASLIAVIPIVLENLTKFGRMGLGGTALLIIVGVALEINKQLKAQLVMRHYEGFLK